MLTIMAASRCSALQRSCARALRMPQRHYTNSTVQKRVAIVGAGPSGLYTAQYLLKVGFNAVACSHSLAQDARLGSTQCCN
jgi:ribulose 1,5-bisphosphate synthetase/thiazole synthase